MLRTVISYFAKAFPGETDSIPPPGKVKGMTYNQNESALRLGALMLAWVKQYLQNTLPANEN
jgi:hypothetical protein